MRTGIIGTKIGNSSFYNDDGKVIPVTVVRVDECIVSGVKTNEKDGYYAVQLASIENNLKLSNINKPQRKIFSSLETNPKRVLKEFRVLKENLLDVGTKIDVSHFQKDQFVDVTGTSSGKGFAGSMKRHNFAGLRASHGVSISHRAHGSTGNSQDPGRVFKGKKMAGRMGAKNITKQNLKIVDIDEKNKIIVVKGAVPGKNNSIVFLSDAVKKS